ncbi:unnamed protein product, partial [Plutella xylostella]
TLPVVPCACLPQYRGPRSTLLLQGPRLRPRYGLPTTRICYVASTARPLRAGSATPYLRVADHAAQPSYTPRAR